MSLSVPKSLFGILSLLLILGYFVSSLTGNDELYSWHPTVESNMSKPYSEMDIWDKLGILVDVPISVVTTSLGSIAGLTMMFGMIPVGFGIIKTILALAIILYLAGRFIK